MPARHWTIHYEVKLFSVGFDKVTPDIDVNESPHGRLVPVLALTCALGRAPHCGVLPAWQVVARLVHLSTLRTAPTHLSGTITAPPAPHHRWRGLFRATPPLSFLFYLWLIVSLVDCVCLSPPLSFFILRLFLSLPPPSAATIILLPPHFPSLRLPARNSTVQLKSITPKPLTVCGIYGNRY